MYFDQFDICDAFYVFATLYHGGQFSEEYRIFGRLEKIGYQPTDTLNEDTLSDNARVIYDKLVTRHNERYAVQHG